MTIHTLDTPLRGPLLILPVAPKVPEGDWRLVESNGSEFEFALNAVNVYGEDVAFRVCPHSPGDVLTWREECEQCKGQRFIENDPVEGWNRTCPFCVDGSVTHQRIVTIIDCRRVDTVTYDEAVAVGMDTSNWRVGEFGFVCRPEFGGRGIAHWRFEHDWNSRDGHRFDKDFAWFTGTEESK